MINDKDELILDLREPRYQKYLFSGKETVLRKTLEVTKQDISTFVILSIFIMAKRRSLNRMIFGNIINEAEIDGLDRAVFPIRMLINLGLLKENFSQNDNNSETIQFTSVQARQETKRFVEENFSAYKEKLFPIGVAALTLIQREYDKYFDETEINKPITTQLGEENFSSVLAQNSGKIYEPLRIYKEIAYSFLEGFETSPPYSSLVKAKSHFTFCRQYVEFFSL